MKKLAPITVPLLFLLLAACHSPKVSTEYSVRSWSEIRSGQKTPLTTAKVWGAYLDAGEWRVDSYADATANPPLATLISDESGSTKREFTIELQPDGDNVAFSYTFTRKPLMLLVYDTQEPMFAYGNGNIVDDLPAASISLLFQPWNSNVGPYDYGNGNHWKITNGDTSVPVSCRYTLQPRQKLTEEGTGNVPVPEMTGYAIMEVVDTANWEVLTIDDARAGILTHKVSLEKRAYDAGRGDQRIELAASADPAELEQRDMMFIFGDDPGTEKEPTNAPGQLSSRNVMFILADKTRPMFAYGGADMLKNPLRTSESILFLPYRSDYDSHDQGNGRWRVINDGIPVTPPDPEP